MDQDTAGGHDNDAHRRENTSTAPTLALAESLTEGDAAARLGLKVATLRAWRHRSKGPAFVRLGRAVRYLSTDLDEFLRATDTRRHLTRPTALSSTKPNERSGDESLEARQAVLA